MNYRLNIQLAPRSKLLVSVIKINLLTLYWEIMAVNSKMGTQHINKLWAEC
jgi:hypothetical protein